MPSLLPTARGTLLTGFVAAAPTVRAPAHGRGCAAHAPGTQAARPPCTEAGVGSVLAVVTVLVLVTLAAVGGLAMSYAAASRSVRQAADLVAVSGAQAHAQGADACAEARRIAGRNEVAVGVCEVTGDQIDFVVEVRVSRRLGWRMPGLPESVATTAYAGNVAGVP